MATAHRPPPPGTCHTYFNNKTHHEPRGGCGWGWGKPKAKRQAKAEQNHEGKSAQQWHNYACPQQTSAEWQQISWLILIIDNLIKSKYMYYLALH